ncbi:MAG: hypothetical protein SZ59_C0001G0131 [candidate division TM6 bacterium GW2011_GWF2_28_16]|nr:MAG: hypothetical protein SZ59_C0001G0131 [candidate division TM6 bacterium GW2011_GWF2_28_16]
MIPLKLELKNFLSYGDSVHTVEFKDYSLICLSGKNGNGKSALLDAITWVLWGQARKITGTVKPDEGLLRLGQSKMMVSMEFNFAGNIYRVRREYTKTYGKPLIYLDLEVFDITKDKFLTLTDKTIKNTQEKIEKLLGLDYTTFTNSAFLRQGAADEFSKKSAKERKQILANILGFNRYEDLSSLALNKAKIINENINLNLKIQENYEKEILKEENLKCSYNLEKENLNKINTNIIEQEQNLSKNNLEYNNFLKIKDKYKFFKEELDKINIIYTQKFTEYNDLALLWKQEHYKIIKINLLLDLEKEKKNILEKEKEFSLTQQRVLLLQEELLKNKELYQNLSLSLQEKNNQDLNKLKLEIQKNEIELNQLLSSKKSLELELKNLLSQKEKYISEKNKLAKNLLNAKNNQELIEKTLLIFEKRRSFYQLLIERGNWLKNEYIDLKDKLEVIKKQESPACPLCEQVLTVRRKSFLANKFLSEVNLVSYKLVRPTNIIKKLKNLLLEQHEQIKILKEKEEIYKLNILKNSELDIYLNDLENKLSIVNKSLIELDKNIAIYKDNLKKLSQDLIIFEKNIDNLIVNNFNNKDLKELFDTIKKIEQEKGNLNYNETEHKQIRENLNLIEQKISLVNKLEDQKLLQVNRRSKITFIYMQLKEFKLLKLKIENDIEKLNLDLSKELLLEKNIIETKNILDSAKIQKEACVQKITVLEHEVNNILKLKKEFENNTVQLNLLTQEMQEYQVLAQAFGKNGIQALLIEQAIPQIEEEANNILSRLTDNQAQIFIESLRDLKSGGVKETLDIKISDSIGIRPYEMFSGGEAFRVDFALRIAISKLLARRAGIALQTLIIDEGFGSQDEDGLSRLMDAIYAIKNDFSKIIVVSHLESFKENFPVHFVVQKNSSGSFVSVYERG